MHRKNSLIYIMRFAGKEYYLDIIRMKLYVNDQKKPIRFDKWTVGLAFVIGFVILVPYWIHSISVVSKTVLLVVGWLATAKWISRMLTMERDPSFGEFHIEALDKQAEFLLRMKSKLYHKLWIGLALLYASIFHAVHYIIENLPESYCMSLMMFYGVYLCLGQSHILSQRKIHKELTKSLTR